MQIIIVRPAVKCDKIPRVRITDAIRSASRGRLATFVILSLVAVIALRFSPLFSN